MLPLDKAMQASRVLYYLDLLQCVLPALFGALPPPARSTLNLELQTLEVRCCCCCCCCQSRLDKKSKKIRPAGRAALTMRQNISVMCGHVFYFLSLVGLTLHSLFFTCVPSKHVACGCAALCSSHLSVTRRGLSFFWGFLIHEISMTLIGLTVDHHQC